MPQDQSASLQTLQDIRNNMDRSARFISLSGWSGVWAGSVALAGSAIAYSWLKDQPAGFFNPYAADGVADAPTEYYSFINSFIFLALGILVVAILGAFYFTWRKTKQQGGNVWNAPSKRMVAQIAIPMTAGAIFALHFLFNGHESYVAPVFLTFYGLALINGSKYTVSDIRYLGLLEVILGCISLMMPGNGLIFWAVGFGVLHILYGIIMWNKYDKHPAS